MHLRNQRGEAADLSEPEQHQRHPPPGPLNLTSLFMFWSRHMPKMPPPAHPTLRSCARAPGGWSSPPSRPHHALEVKVTPCGCVAVT
ncbi:hypothetical protein E2C01_007552 [Portunus trituberculatus]|uniref:Uncharacterized protein n=1 Tax=Portunus trituberculatus TaxID=210409 RepID=A0A5B7D2Q1_PORTR|nr:hypothetical protein [Portunus trituberculatus]